MAAAAAPVRYAIFAWITLRPWTMVGAVSNFRLFFRTGEWPTPEEQIDRTSEANALDKAETSEPS